ncbi:hypothetical protein ACSTIZ_02450 [Vibrio parahaemolyticus]|uniref:hypothetical protein n=1 Tax=Vibrio alginolyticus TaxID=663 RepID=UPI001BD69839|nr:hypothetical protein [Vibrio alginolyticus]MBS9898900.1 hypothetical protein [Vibrio alginolyticus]
MTIKTFNTSKGTIVLSNHGATVSMAISRNAGAVANVCVSWVLGSADEAKAFIEGADEKAIRNEMPRFSMCADVVKQLDKALANGNSKKPVEPTHRAYGTVYEMPPQVEFIPHDEIYVGFFDTTIIDHMQGLGIITLLGVHDDERQAIKLNERDDFLASWSAGVNEARNGSDLHYADYNNNQYAFTAGYEHWHNRNKKALKGRLAHYSISREYLCHGFIDEDTGEIWHQ